MSNIRCNSEMAKREQDKPRWRRRMIYVELERRTEPLERRIADLETEVARLARLIDAGASDG